MAHFWRDDGRVDTAQYAKMVAADRDLKLSGYEVFRFGAEELVANGAKTVVPEFFESLFKVFRVNPIKKSA